MEIIGLSACDIRPNDGGVCVAVNRTKNDQEGFKRTSTLEYAEERQRCSVRWLQMYLVLTGKSRPRPGCTNASHPTRECHACPRLFENILSSGVVRNHQETRGLPKYRVSYIVKLVMAELVVVGVAEKKELRRYSSKSMRVGATSAAAAGGVRCQVAAEHLRMRSESTLKHYDRQLASELGAVSRVLHGQIAGTAGRAARGGT